MSGNPKNLSSQEKEKQLRLIDQLYENLWSHARGWRSDIFGFVAAAVGVAASMKYGLDTNSTSSRLLYVILANEIFLTWVLLIICEAAYTYRVYQAISSNIERIFRVQNYNAQEIFPKRFLEPESSSQEIYRIHMGFFIIVLVFQPFLFLCAGHPPACGESYIAFSGLLGALLIFFSFNQCRWKKYRKDFG